MKKSNLPTEVEKSSQLTLVLIIEIILGLATVIGSLFIFINIAWKFVEGPTHQLDLAISTFFYSLRTPLLTTIMKGVTFLGSDIFLGSATVITIIMLWRRKYYKDGFLFIFILIFGVLLNMLLKQLFGRERPDMSPLIYESSLSFPSGHAMAATVFYTALTYVTFHITRKKRLATLLTVLTIFLVGSIGISRIYLGAHYPSDVLAGFAAGLLWFAFVFICRKTITFLRIFKEKK